MPLQPIPSYPSELYPHSKAELEQILTDYYSLTLQLQTLQRHILKIQTENERQHQIFNDEVEKLKLYIDQCQNQIKKREERELVLIDRLKELEISRYEEIQELKFSRSSKKANQDLINQLQSLIKQKQSQWNREKISLIKKSESLMLQNIQFGKEIASLKLLIQQISNQKSEIASQLKNLSQLINPNQSQTSQLTKSLSKAESIIEELARQNKELKELHSLAERRLFQQQKILPISSSCPNCLKLSKIHAIQLEKKTAEIESLKKDVECLLVFFETVE